MYGSPRTVRPTCKFWPVGRGVPAEPCEEDDTNRVGHSWRYRSYRCDLGKAGAASRHDEHRAPN
jgi:hypothetical protein